MTRVSALVATTEERRRWLPFLAWQLDTHLDPQQDEIIMASEDYALALELQRHLPRFGPIAWVNVPRQPCEVPKKRNALLDAARGQYVCWVDDDDWHHPRWLHSALSVLGWDARQVALDGYAPRGMGRPTWVLYRGLRYVDLDELVTWTAKAWWRSPSMGTLVAERRVARSLVFDETRERGSDTAWKKALQLSAIGCIVEPPATNSPLIIATRHGGNMSTWLHRPEVVPRNAKAVHVLRDLYPDVPKEHWDAYFEHLDRLNLLPT